MPSVLYGRKIIEFKVIRKVRMKHSYIHVTSDGVIVKANKSISLRELEDFVSRKSAWIVKQLECIKSKKLDEILRTGSRFYYLGKDYDVQIIEEEVLKKTVLEFSDSTFLITVKKGASQEELALVVNKFYKQKAIENITPLLDKWSVKMGLTPTYVGYRKAKTRWGSCSAKDRISFNYYLMKMPLSLVEYVVVHELAHIRHKNHSVSFWGLVESYLSDYKFREKQIKNFEKVI